MKLAWALAPAAAIWTYAAATIAAEAFPAVALALTWWPAVGAYSGKCAVAGAAFVACAGLARGTVRSWERWAAWLPAVYLSAIAGTFPPVTAGLAEGLRRAVGWGSQVP